MISYPPGKQADMFQQVLDYSPLFADRPLNLGFIAKSLVDAVDKDEHVQSGISREDIVRQLSEEFEVDVRCPLAQVEGIVATHGDEVGGAQGDVH